MNQLIEFDFIFDNYYSHRSPGVLVTVTLKPEVKLKSRLSWWRTMKIVWLSALRSNSRSLLNQLKLVVFG
jgi:hypothetical protein